MNKDNIDFPFIYHVLNHKITFENQMLCLWTRNTEVHWEFTCSFFEPATHEVPDV